jgi:hypothetical protein
MKHNNNLEVLLRSHAAQRCQTVVQGHLLRSSMSSSDKQVAWQRVLACTCAGPVSRFKY